MGSKKLETTIFEFIQNRTKQNESTTSRHIHRRFDISIEEAEKILIELLEQNIVQESYDNEYQENRYTTRK